MYTIIGIVLLVFGCASFWYLLPRKGVVHPWVRNSDIGSMVTITIMTILTAGFGFLFAGLLS